jgi:hypothetical protein
LYTHNGKKVQDGVLGSDEGVVASHVIRMPRHQQTVAPVFFSELDDMFADDGRHGANVRTQGIAIAMGAAAFRSVVLCHVTSRHVKLSLVDSKKVVHVLFLLLLRSCLEMI